MTFTTEPNPVPLLTYQPLKIQADLTAPGVDTLLDILTYKRLASSDTEEEFIEKFLRPFDPYRDAYGNLIVEIGENPTIMWSCHTDTVHHTEGRQEVYVDGVMARVKVKKVKTYRTDPKTGARWSKKSKNTNCLGADNGGGIWLLLEMMKANIPGLYIFHRDEESGGGGSSHIAKNTPNLLKGIKFAIAFDRKGYSDVITHQGWSRCCSDDFAKSMAAILGGTFKPDDGGLFTDTANYTDLVGECTNISMGYFNGHGPTECLDIDFIVELRDILVNADWSSLVYKREPGEFDDDRWSGVYGSSYSNWNKNYTPSTHKARSYPRSDYTDMTSDEWDQYLLDKYGPQVVASLRNYPETDIPMQNMEKVKVGRTKGGYVNDRDGVRDTSSTIFSSLDAFIAAHPMVVSAFLEEQGYNLWELEQYGSELIDLR